MTKNYKRLLRICGVNILGVAIMLHVVGCSQNRQEIVNLSLNIAQSGNLHNQVIKTPQYPIQSFFRINNSTLPVRIYIEGDGMAWATSNQPSFDPTPQHSMLLHLAAQDAYPNVVYLARPCQYVMAPHCTQHDWTDGRFAQNKLDSLSHAIQHFTHAPVELVGYSGGAAMVVLLSQIVPIINIRTIAANLDPEDFNAWHDVSPTSGSLSTKVALANMRSIPQLHVVGSADQITPERLVRKALSLQGANTCAQVLVVEAATHETGYDVAWQNLLQNPAPSCIRKTDSEPIEITPPN